jgi:hypothetical protein
VERDLIGESSEAIELSWDVCILCWLDGWQSEQISLLHIPELGKVSRKDGNKKPREAEICNNEH